MSEERKQFKVGDRVLFEGCSASILFLHDKGGVTIGLWERSGNPRRYIKRRVSALSLKSAPIERTAFDAQEAPVSKER